MQLCIQLYRQEKKLKDITLTLDKHRPIKIGRMTSAQLRMDDEGVARIQAMIEYDGEDVWLQDMAGSTGTLMEGRKINKVALHHGDRVVMGQTTLLIGLHQFVVDSTLPLASMDSAQTTTPDQVEPILTSLAPSQHLMDPTLALEDSTSTAIPLKSIDASVVQPTTALEPEVTQSWLEEDQLTDQNKMLELRYYWGNMLLGVFHYPKLEAVTLGESREANILISSANLPAPIFPLIQKQGDTYVLHIAKQMAGEIELAGQVYSFEQAFQAGKSHMHAHMQHTQATPLPKDARALIHYAGATFALRFVPQIKLKHPASYLSWDRMFLGAFFLSLTFHVVSIAVLLLTPIDLQLLKPDVFGQTNRFTKFLVQQPVVKTESPDQLLEKLRMGEPAVPMPKETQIKQQLILGQPTPKLSTPVPHDPSFVRRQRIQEKFNHLFRTVRSDPTQQGSADLKQLQAPGFSIVDNIRELRGKRFSAEGSNPALSQHQRIEDAMTKLRPSPLDNRFVDKGPSTHQMIEFAPSSTVGSLDKEVIRGVIYQHKNQVLHCYELSLQLQHDLEGRVLMHLLIGADGAVKTCTIKESNLHNKDVETCICRAALGWIFPPPAGGGTVEVNYPFVFRRN